jgi:nicotinamide riboside transporter PnuC
MVYKNLFGIVDVQFVLHTFVLLYVFGIVDVNIFLYILYLVKVDEVGL